MAFPELAAFGTGMVAAGIVAGCLYGTFFLPLIAVVGCLHTLPSAKRNP